MSNLVWADLNDALSSSDSFWQGIEVKESATPGLFEIWYDGSTSPGNEAEASAGISLDIDFSKISQENGAWTANSAPSILGAGFSDAGNLVFSYSAMDFGFQPWPGSVPSMLGTIKFNTSAINPGPIAIFINSGDSRGQSINPNLSDRLVTEYSDSGKFPTLIDSDTGIFFDTTSSSDPDFIAFEVPAGTEFDVFKLADYAGTNQKGFYLLAAGDYFDSAIESAVQSQNTAALQSNPNVIAYGHFGTSADPGVVNPGESILVDGSYSSDALLGPGFYTMLLQQTGGESAYQFEFGEGLILPALDSALTGGVFAGTEDSAFTSIALPANTDLDRAPGEALTWSIPSGSAIPDWLTVNGNTLHETGTGQPANFSTNDFGSTGPVEFRLLATGDQSGNTKLVTITLEIAASDDDTPEILSLKDPNWKILASSSSYSEINYDQIQQNLLIWDDTDPANHSFKLASLQNGEALIGTNLNSAQPFQAGSHDVITAGQSIYWKSDPFTPSESFAAFSIQVSDNNGQTWSNTQGLAAIGNATPVINGKTDENWQINAARLHYTEIPLSELKTNLNIWDDTSDALHQFRISTIANGAIFIGSELHSALPYAAGTHEIIQPGESIFWRPDDLSGTSSSTFSVQVSDNNGQTWSNAQSLDAIESFSITGVEEQGAELSINHLLAHPNELALINYQWERSSNGVSNWQPISGANASTYELKQDDVNAYLRLKAQETSGGSQNPFYSQLSGTIANINDQPVGSVAITGAAKQGVVLQAQQNISDADGLGAISYSWERSSNGVSWTTINSANAASYRLTQADVGLQIRSVASYIDGFNFSETVASSGTGAIENINDAPQGSVTIDGVASEGESINAAHNLSDADGMGAVNYQWQVSSDGIGGWQDLTGETSEQLSLNAQHIEQYVRAIASYTDGYGQRETVASAASEAVENANSLPTGPLEIYGYFKAGNTLNLSTHLIADADNPSDWKPTYNFSWEQSFDQGQHWQPITTSDGLNNDPNYTIRPQDESSLIRGIAEFTDWYGTSEAITSAARSAEAFELKLKGSGALGTPISVDTSSIPDQYTVLRYGWETAGFNGSVVLDPTAFSWELNKSALTLKLFHQGIEFNSQSFNDISELSTFLNNESHLSLTINNDTWSARLFSNELGTTLWETTNNTRTGKFDSVIPLITNNLLSTHYPNSPEWMATFEDKGYYILGSHITHRKPNSDNELNVAFEIGTNSIPQISDQFSLSYESLFPATWDMTYYDEGKRYRAYAKVRDSEGNISTVRSEPIAIGIASGGVENTASFKPNNAPKGSLFIDQIPIAGNAITLNALTITDEDTIDSDFAYSWQVFDHGSSSWLALDTTDATDGDASLQLTTALAGQELRGRASYSDGNGLTEIVTSDSFLVEPELISGEVQEISFHSSTINYTPGSIIHIPVRYQTGNNQQNLPGIRFNIHYNSNLLTPTGSTTGVSNLFGAQQDGMITGAAIGLDSHNSDGDISTDKFIQLTWFSLASEFPGTELPETLANLSFQTSESEIDPLTGAPQTTRLNISAVESPTGYSFVSKPAVLKATPFSLDVDGDGRVAPMSDGIMIIRKLIGGNYEGDELTRYARSANATRSTEEIHNFIQSAIDSQALDLDLDGRITPMSDGILLIRSMLGIAFEGDALIDKALSPNSPYQGQVDAADSIRTNINALMPQF